MENVITEDVTLDAKDTNEILVLPLSEVHAIEDFFEVRTDIIYKERIVLSGNLRGIIRAYTGCGFEATDDAVNVYEKYLEVCKLKVNLEQCADDLGSSWFAKWLKKGTNIDDLTDTAVQDFIVAQVLDAMKFDIPTISWFGDTDSNDDFLASCDGVWKRIFEAIDEYSGQRLWDFGATLADCEAIDAMRALVEGAPAELDAQPENMKQILLTRELYDNFLTCREDACCGDRSFDMLEQGKRQLYFRGIPVYKMTEWSVDIKTYSLALPHRIMYTLKGNLVVGTDAVSSEQSFDFWYDKKDEKNYIKLKMKWGTQVIFDPMTVVGY